MGVKSLIHNVEATSLATLGSRWDGHFLSWHSELGITDRFELYHFRRLPALSKILTLASFSKLHKSAPLATRFRNGSNSFELAV